MQFNGRKSGLQNVTCGVPQLFPLCINDICNVSNMLDLFYMLMIQMRFVNMNILI